MILEGPPLAAESSFPPEAGDPPSRLDVVPWVVSARSERALREQADQLRTHLRRNSDASALDVGLSLTSRARLEHRAVILGADRDALLCGLEALAEGRPAADVLTGSTPSGGPIAFLFGGQGAQHAGMGSELCTMRRFRCSRRPSTRRADCSMLTSNARFVS